MSLYHFIGATEFCTGCGERKRCRAIVETPGRFDCWCEPCWDNFLGLAYEARKENHELSLLTGELSSPATVARAEDRFLSEAERQTLAALRHDALTGPLMFEDSVNLIERLLIQKLRAMEEGDSKVRAV